MARPGLLVDIAPLRRYPRFRRLWLGYLVSTLGNQITVVGVAFEVFKLTGSSLDVGLVSLTQLGPLLLGSMFGGSIEMCIRDSIWIVSLLDRKSVV